MRNHNRRIKYAKKVVDTSPPLSYKFIKPRCITPIGYNYKSKQPFLLRNVSPPLTDRSISTNSNKESFREGQHISNSRYHTNCMEDSSGVDTSKKHHLYYDKNLVDRITYDTKNRPSSYW